MLLIFSGCCERAPLLHPIHRQRTVSVCRILVDLQYYGLQSVRREIRALYGRELQTAEHLYSEQQNRMPRADRRRLQLHVA